MALFAPQSHIFFTFPPEMVASVMIYLRASDCAKLQQSCVFFNSPELIHRVISTVSREVYPPSLTRGFTSPQISGPNSCSSRGQVDDDDDNLRGKDLKFINMRNMEMLVVARVLSSPEPSLNAQGDTFWISKAWCKSALKWLDSTQTPKKQLSKRKQRTRERRFSDVLPPWPNINVDITCEHSNLAVLPSNVSKKKKNRQVVDRQAMRVLKKLYPDTLTFATSRWEECPQCRELLRERDYEAEHVRNRKMELKAVVMCDNLLRSIFMRTKGLPSSCLVVNRHSQCQEDRGGGEVSSKKSGGYVLSSSPSSVLDLDVDVDVDVDVDTSALGMTGLTLTDVDTDTDTDADASNIITTSAIKRTIHSRQATVTVPHLDFKTPPPPPPPSPAPSVPLIANTYHALPRYFLKQWRSYVKCGGDEPCPPSLEEAHLVCSAHHHSLIPPHLTSFLYGQTSTLFEGGTELDNLNATVVEVITEVRTQLVTTFCLYDLRVFCFYPFMCILQNPTVVCCPLTIITYITRNNSLNSVRLKISVHDRTFTIMPLSNLLSRLTVISTFQAVLVTCATTPQSTLTLAPRGSPGKQGAKVVILAICLNSSSLTSTTINLMIRICCHNCCRNSCI